MSQAPVMGTVGEALHDALLPLAYADEDNGYVFAHLCEAIGLMYQQVADLSEDQDDQPGWAALVDVELAPDYALPWLAQIPGARITAGAPGDVVRGEVRRRSGQARGRPASMIARAQTTLTGARTVRLLERAGGFAWRLTVLTRTSETPDPAATLAALMSEKPIGIVLTHVVSDAPIVDEITRPIDNLTEPVDDLSVAGTT